MDKENDIVEGLRRNRKDAQRHLLQQYGEKVFAQITRIVLRQEDAEEVYQDVFVKAFRHIDSYDPRRASLATWLFRIAYHEALNAIRGKKATIIHLEDSPTELKDISEKEVDKMLGDTDEETISLIEQALEQLSLQDQSLVTMFYYDDLSLKEIAYITDSPSSTIASRLFRIRQKLYHIILALKKR